MPLNQISQQLNFVVMALAGAERIFTLMDEPVEIDEGQVTLVNVRQEHGQMWEVKERTGQWAWKDGTTGSEPKYTPLRGAVRFEKVSFGYRPDKEVLHKISFFAKPGQKIAFVGATGAGKTTITNLLNRFYDVKQGAILYDDINVKRIKKSDLRRSLGMVLQDTNLFTGCVRDNIAYGKLTASDSEITVAARRANADGFIERLPQAYKTKLAGDGNDLSQGQRQLISIARVAVNDPPVLVLDEATSSIDTRTEKIVQTGMDNLMHGRTTLVIAHRMSTVKSAQAILVLEQGRIIERGDHHTLLKEKGVYHQLYTGALEWE
jgi:ATP-binding cassette subfamily B protein